MGISTEFYSDQIDTNFVVVNAKSVLPFSPFVNQVLNFTVILLVPRDSGNFRLNTKICAYAVEARGSYLTNTDTVTIVAQAKKSLLFGKAFLRN